MISIEEIQKSFGSQRALKDVSFSLPLGGVSAILGPNGAGKSTLLNVIAGFLKPDAGLVSMDSTSLTGLSPDAVARFGVRLVFQGTRLWESMSVYENLVTACENAKGYDKVAIDRALDLSGLLSHANNRPSEISAGQRRILSIALALVAEPRVLLLDEPSATLDAQNSARVFDYILHIDRTDKIIILVEHNLHLLAGFVDSAIFLHNGEVLATGSYDEIIKRDDLRQLYLGLAN